MSANSKLKHENATSPPADPPLNQQRRVAWSGRCPNPLESSQGKHVAIK